jgi:hypothetical protein
MELQLSDTQQQKLFELYRILQVPPNEVNIQMSSGKIQVKCNEIETTLLVPTFNKKRNIELFVNEAYDADIDFDMTVKDEENLIKLLQYASDPHMANGQKILAYSKIWEKSNRRVKEEGTSLLTIKRELESLTNKNSGRIMRIAKGAHKVMEIMGDFFPRKLELITPTWLQHVKRDDFESFLVQTQIKYRKGIEHLAGARN